VLGSHTQSSTVSLLNEISINAKQDISTSKRWPEKLWSNLCQFEQGQAGEPGEVFDL